MFQIDQSQFSETAPVDVTIVMPCLNERLSLPHCIANAQDALRQIETRHGFSGEIVIADNGSTDGSQVLARSLGARVTPVAERGYGAALIGGCRAARGRYILMGDCDGSYDFTDGVAMIGKLAEGYALCMGSRFDGGITPGAMPWKNRWIGNPALTGILNLFFRAGINDAHCGLRAITREGFDVLRLSGKGMEFASEMVIKAALLKLPIAQVPAKLLPDLRQRAPHLRPWRDGWRHLRYLFMLSPTWLFGVPALCAALAATIIFLLALSQVAGLLDRAVIGESWLLFGGTMASLAHLGALMGLASSLYGRKQGYRGMGPFSAIASRFVTFETMLLSGLVLGGLGMIGFGMIFANWTSHGYTAASSLFPALAAMLALALGAQNIFGAFLLAIIGGNEANFMAKDSNEQPVPPIVSRLAA